MSGFDAIDRRFKKPGIKLECLRCGSTEGVAMEDARTAYHHEPGEDDPNRSVPLCRPCAVLHHDYWDSMWAEYYASRW